MEAAKIANAAFHPPHALLLPSFSSSPSSSPSSPTKTTTIIALNLTTTSNRTLPFGYLLQSHLVSPKHILHRLNPPNCIGSLHEFPADDDEGITEGELQVRVAEWVEEMMEREHKKENNKIFPNGFGDKEEGDTRNFPPFRTLPNSSPVGTVKAPWRAIEPNRPDWHPGDTADSPSATIRSNIFDLQQIATCGERWKEGFSDAGESACCSAKKAFASMVFIIREMQSYSLRLRETLSYEDLQSILAKVHKEMQASFVWLFQKIFSGTPTLMVYVMLLLANFTVYSMGQNVVIAMAKLPPLAAECLGEADHEHHDLSLTACSTANGIGSHSNTEAWVTEGSDDENVDVSSSELSRDEMELWNSVVEEASRMESEWTDESLDHETMLQFVSPGKPPMEPNGPSFYLWTELLYQRAIAEDPNNPLFLSNYAQFIHQVYRDADRAEEYFARAARCETPDSEAMSRYARFMWHVRKDLWAAEEYFIRAFEAEPNAHYAGQYANFLHRTGAQDTCFPLE